MKTIKIKEEFQIPGTDIILEAGDRIEINEAEKVRSAPKMIKLIMGAFEKSIASPAFYEVKSLKEGKTTSSGSILTGDFSMRVSWDFVIDYLDRQNDLIGSSSGSFLLVTNYNDTSAKSRFSFVANHKDEDLKVSKTNDSVEGDF